MDTKDILKSIPREGFLKVDTGERPSLSPEQKTALIRKGNELFNRGEYEKAKRVFLTTGYTDGIIRIGDYYYKNKRPLEALRMYRVAPAPSKVEILIERMARVINKWLQE
jgi:hypothetical protein